MSQHYNKKSGRSKECFLKEESHKLQEVDKMSKKLENSEMKDGICYFFQHGGKKKGKQKNHNPSIDPLN